MTNLSKWHNLSSNAGPAPPCSYPVCSKGDFTFKVLQALRPPRRPRARRCALWRLTGTPDPAGSTQAQPSRRLPHHQLSVAAWASLGHTNYWGSRDGGGPAEWKSVRP